MLHTIIILALISAYVAVTLAHQDGTALLGVLAGYVGAGGVQMAALITKNGAR